MRADLPRTLDPLSCLFSVVVSADHKTFALANLKAILLFPLTSGLHYLLDY